MQPTAICKTYLGDARIVEILGTLTSLQVKSILKEGAVKVKLPGGFVSQARRRQIWSDRIRGAIGAENEAAASEFLQQWLLNHRRQMLIDYLDHLGISHRGGETEDSFLLTCPAEKAIEAGVAILGKYPKDEAAAYLVYIAYQQRSKVFDDWSPLSPDSVAQATAQLPPVATGGAALAPSTVPSDTPVAE